MEPPSSESARSLDELAREFGLADVYVFGSRRDEFAPHRPLTAHASHAESDVDIAVRPRENVFLSPERRVELTLALERALGVDRVDLALLPEAGPFLALAAIRGNLLYCADSVDQAEYELFVLRRAGDLAHFERERQELVLNGGR
jgi:uncharacterized protein